MLSNSGRGSKFTLRAVENPFWKPGVKGSITTTTKSVSLTSVLITYILRGKYELDRNNFSLLGANVLNLIEIAIVYNRPSSYHFKCTLLQFWKIYEFIQFHECLFSTKAWIYNNDNSIQNIAILKSICFVLFRPDSDFIYHNRKMHFLKSLKCFFLNTKSK